MFSNLGDDMKTKFNEIKNDANLTKEQFKTKMDDFVAGLKDSDVAKKWNGLFSSEGEVWQKSDEASKNLSECARDGYKKLQEIRDNASITYDQQKAKFKEAWAGMSANVRNELNKAGIREQDQDVFRRQPVPVTKPEATLVEGSNGTAAPVSRARRQELQGRLGVDAPPIGTEVGRPENAEPQEEVKPRVTRQLASDDANVNNNPNHSPNQQSLAQPMVDAKLDSTENQNPKHPPNQQNLRREIQKAESTEEPNKQKLPYGIQEEPIAMAEVRQARSQLDVNPPRHPDLDRIPENSATGERQQRFRRQQGGVEMDVNPRQPQQQHVPKAGQVNQQEP